MTERYFLPPEPWTYPEARLGIKAVDEAAIRYLSGRWGILHLLAEPTLITLEVAKVQQKLMVAVYVDGTLPARWQSGKDPADLDQESARWLCAKSRFLHSQKTRKSYKRYAKDMRAAGICIDPHARLYWLEPFFSTPAAAIRHIAKQRPWVLTPTTGKAEVDKRKQHTPDDTTRPSAA